MVYRVVSIVLVVLVVLTGCATGPTTSSPAGADQPKTQVEEPKPAAEQPKPTADQTKPTAKPAISEPRGTLTAAISSFADDILDPIRATVSTSTLIAPMFEYLTAFDERGKLVPRLAESWSVSSDGKVWTLKIRKGVKFHNGDELTSADVKFSLERLMLTKAVNNWTPVFRNDIANINAPDPYTIMVTTKEVNANFAYNTVGAVVMPKKYIEEKGEDYFAKNPVGTGPWKFVNHQPGSSLELEAVKDHWRIMPAFQKLVIKLVPEEGTRMAMLKRGELDITEVSLDTVDEVKSAGLELRFGSYESQPMVLIPGTWLNTGQPTMEVKVRQALSLALNREEMSKTFFKGLASPSARRAMADYSWAWDPTWKPDPYDPKKAQDLLAEAGYPSKFKDPAITVYAQRQAGAGWMAQWAEIVSGYWEAVGVKTKITPIDAAALRAMYMARPLDPKIVGTVYPMAGATSNNTVAIAWNGFGSTGIFGVMNDPEWDALYGKVLKELDEGKRIDLFREAMNRGHNQYVNLMTVNVKLVYAVSKNVGEWRGTSGSLGGMFEGVQHK